MKATEAVATARHGRSAPCASVSLILKARPAHCSTELPDHEGAAPRSGGSAMGAAGRDAIAGHEVVARDATGGPPRKPAGTGERPTTGTGSGQRLRSPTATQAQSRELEGNRAATGYSDPPRPAQKPAGAGAADHRRGQRATTAEPDRHPGPVTGIGGQTRHGSMGARRPPGRGRAERRSAWPRGGGTGGFHDCVRHHEGFLGSRVL